MRLYSLNDEEIAAVNDLRLLVTEQRTTLYEVIHELASRRTPSLTLVAKVIPIAAPRARAPCVPTPANNVA